MVRELISNDDEKPSTEKLQRLVFLIGADPENYKETYVMLMKHVTDYKNLHYTEKVEIKNYNNLKKYKYISNGRDCDENGYMGNIFYSNQIQINYLKLKNINKLKKINFATVRQIALGIVQMLENEEELVAARYQAQGLVFFYFCDCDIFNIYVYICHVFFQKKYFKTNENGHRILNIICCEYKLHKLKKDEKEHSNKLSDESKSINMFVYKKQNFLLKNTYDIKKMKIKINRKKENILPKKGNCKKRKRNKQLYIKKNLTKKEK
ncbi:hypothetical protein RFI_05061 [Reticulomyxa filosa]|uniref:Uncharacterized protein n=1 Tax=Reticulomyxa filosa TaxID=46433 RepID=X6P1D1_RETFI|nr:hypothetical protein RFI_05061 [Reticulomyxa filosa]|eukprot:ETO32056.1 hypothetical protein RFI_05061 [Reticulomyxa filosa]